MILSAQNIRDLDFDYVGLIEKTRLYFNPEYKLAKKIDDEGKIEYTCNDVQLKSAEEASVYLNKQYYVRRTSLWLTDERPCEEAWKAESGKWVVTMDTMERLRAFIRKYGEVVVSDTEIEIYDDYRE